MNAGLVTFHPLSDAKSKLTLQMGYIPNGAVEAAGDALGLISRRVERDLTSCHTVNTISIDR